MIRALLPFLPVLCLLFSFFSSTHIHDRTHYLTSILTTGMLQIPYTQQYRTAPLCTHFEILDRHTALPPRFLNALCILFVIQGWTIDTTSAILRVPAGSEPRDATNFIHAAFQPIHLRHRKWSCYGEHRASQRTHALIVRTPTTHRGPASST